MAQYAISGVWKDTNGVITHYAFHTIDATAKTHSKASKLTKTQAVGLLDGNSNTAHTWVWSYAETEWQLGEKVEVVNGTSGQYLRSNPDSELTDNLAHLINYASIF